MSYSKSKKSVKQVQVYLEQLLRTESNITFPAKNPPKLAYQLHQGIYASQFYPDTAKFKNLNKQFRIRLAGVTVVCEMKEVADYDSEKELEKLKSKIVLGDIPDMMGILGAVIKHKADEMLFPDAHPSNWQPAQILSLQAFCNKYEYRIDTFHDEIRLTKL